MISSGCSGEASEKSRRCEKEVPLLTRGWLREAPPSWPLSRTAAASITTSTQVTSARRGVTIPFTTLRFSAPLGGHVRGRCHYRRRYCCCSSCCCCCRCCHDDVTFLSPTLESLFE